MDPSKRTKCSVIVEPYSNGLAEDIAPKLLTTVLNAKGNMKMSQNSRSKNREAMQAAFDAPPKELGAAAVKAASKNDLDEFYEKIGTQKKNVKTMDDMYGDGSYHAVCEKCGYCAAACGDCEQYGCGKANTKGAHDPHGHKRRYWDKR